jgi:hypothetical protein
MTQATNKTISWEEFAEALDKHVEAYCEDVIDKNLEEMFGDM